MFFFYENLILKGRVIYFLMKTLRANKPKLMFALWHTSEILYFSTASESYFEQSEFSTQSVHHAIVESKKKHLYNIFEQCSQLNKPSVHSCSKRPVVNRKCRTLKRYQAILRQCSLWRCCWCQPWTFAILKMSNLMSRFLEEIKLVPWVGHQVMGVVAIGSPYHLVDILLFVRLEASPEEKGLKSSRVCLTCCMDTWEERIRLLHE